MSASARQIEANRRNSAGPHKMTEAGKAVVRGNAVRHGLTSRLQVVLPNEDRQFYEEVRTALVRDYAPATTQEELLVNQIAESFWRLSRARNMESGSFSTSLDNLIRECNLAQQPEDELDQGSRLALAYTQHDKVFSKLGRYEAAIERSYYRAIRELRATQSQRIRSVSQSTQASETSEVEASPEPAPEPIGSVSQSAPPTRRAYTETDAHIATITRSGQDFDDFMDKFTAPPGDRPLPNPQTEP